MLDGDMSEALSAINEVIEKRGTSLSLYYEERARVYFGLKNYSKAIFDFNKSFELSPSDFDHYDYSDRSRAKSFLKDNIGAIKDIEIAIKLDIKNDYYYFLKGLYLSDLNDNSGAIKQYNKAIEINSKNANYYISRGWSKLQNNKTDACADWSIAGELGRYDAYDLIQKYCK